MTTEPETDKKPAWIATMTCLKCRTLIKKYSPAADFNCPVCGWSTAEWGD